MKTPSVVSFALLGLLALQVQGQNAQQRLYTVPDVEFSESQQDKVDAIREKFAPRFAQLQQKQDDVYTDEQRLARREATRAARDAGKTGPEAQKVIDEAVKLDSEQQQKLADLRKEREELQAAIRAELLAILTDEQKASLNRRGSGGARQSRIVPTHPDVHYGPHERNVMDVWLAKSKEPAPLLVSIHGGGFRGGNKSVGAPLLEDCLNAGISVVAITYRLSDDAIAPAQFYDSARAVQYIRSNAKEWNIDPTRIAATGGSAGAGLSLWLGFHDDLADPKNADPVLQQSSRLSCMVVFNGQTSYDPRVIRDLFPGTDTYQHSALSQLYDVDLDKLDQLPDEKYKLFEQVSPITHLTKDDAPAMLIYSSRMDTPVNNQDVGIHHPKFGKMLQEKMDELGIECRVEAGLRSQQDESGKLTMEFLRKHLGMTDTTDNNFSPIE